MKHQPIDPTASMAGSSFVAVNALTLKRPRLATPTRSHHVRQRPARRLSIGKVSLLRPAPADTSSCKRPLRHVRPRAGEGFSRR